MDNAISLTQKTNLELAIFNCEKADTLQVKWTQENDSVFPMLTVMKSSSVLVIDIVILTTCIKKAVANAGAKLHKIGSDEFITSGFLSVDDNKHWPAKA
jgi:hypothetical protein